MNNKQKMNIILWLKRVLGFSAILLWIYTIFTISKSPTPFFQQVPYCMVSTMLIFGLLSGAFKGLEYWERQAKSEK